MLSRVPLLMGDSFLGSVLDWMVRRCVNVILMDFSLVVGLRLSYFPWQFGGKALEK